VYRKKEEITQYWQELFQNSPDVQMEIEEIFSLGERCVLRWRYTWEKEGGEERHTRGVDIFRVRSGFILEMLSYVKG
jgi:predicted SnoaL-like aldol condensation-catalyzing enzyme